MAELVIQDHLAERLRAIAERENRPIEDVLAALLDFYTRYTRAEELAALDGLFDDEITDLSTTVRSTLDAYYRSQHDRPR